jgi:hypothetical protein
LHVSIDAQPEVETRDQHEGEDWREEAEFDSSEASNAIALGGHETTRRAPKAG